MLSLLWPKVGHKPNDVNEHVISKAHDLVTNGEIVLHQRVVGIIIFEEAKKRENEKEERENEESWGPPFSSSGIRRTIDLGFEGFRETL